MPSVAVFWRTSVEAVVSLSLSAEFAEPPAPPFPDAGVTAGPRAAGVGDVAALPPAPPVTAWDRAALRPVPVARFVPLPGPPWPPFAPLKPCPPTPPMPI
jgi:hypothetical protein